MKIQDIIKEGTEIYINGEDNSFAKRMYGGPEKGAIVKMFVTQDEFEDIKDKQANDEVGSYELASAQSIIDSLEKDGYTVVWPDAHSLNHDARELERLSQDPRYKGNHYGLDMEREVAELRRRAKDMARKGLGVVK